MGEPQPVVRLHRISYEMEQLKSTGQMVGAQALVGIAGFAPPTLHSLGARTANGWSRRMFNLVVTNVPGPQFPLYAGGALMLGAYPVVPLAKGQAVSIGLTSYDGGVYFGLNADRDAMTDVDVLAECLETSLQALLDTVPAPGPWVHGEAGPGGGAPAPVTAAPAKAARREGGCREGCACDDAAAPATPAATAAPVDAGRAAVRPRQVSSSALPRARLAPGAEAGGRAPPVGHRPRLSRTRRPTRHAGPVRVYLPLTLTGLAELHAAGRARPRTAGRARGHRAPARATGTAATTRSSSTPPSWPRRSTRSSPIGASGRRAAPRRRRRRGRRRRRDGRRRRDRGAASRPTYPSLACQAVHVDDADAEADVRAALEQLPAALAGDGQALGAVSLVDHELLWFATQEIPDLL